MKSSRFIDSVTYTNRERVVDLPAVGKQWNWLGVNFPATDWTDATEALDVVSEWSLDEGKTWHLLLAFRAHGGTGLPVVGAVTDITPPDGALLRIRVKSHNERPIARDMRLFEDDETPTLRDKLNADIRRRQ